MAQNFHKSGIHLAQGLTSFGQFHQPKNKIKNQFIIIMFKRNKDFAYHISKYYSHKSFTCITTAIPTWLCHDMWQWSNQYPGLFAKNLSRVNPASGTETVSFIGGLIKLRFIFPDSFRSITFCFVIQFPIQGKMFSNYGSVWIWKYYNR